MDLKSKIVASHIKDFNIEYEWILLYSRTKRVDLTQSVHEWLLGGPLQSLQFYVDMKSKMTTTTV